MALDFFAGCVGGCAGVAVGHPFDTVKVRLQTQDFSNPRYKGTWHCLTDTIKQESIRGLYKGMSSPMCGVAFVNAIIFGVHGNMSKRMDNPESLRSQVLCGATAGFCQAFIASPVELVKTRIQLQTEGCSTAVKSVSTSAKNHSTLANCSSYTSPLDCVKKIVTMEGFRGLFRGQLVTVMRDVPGFATYFLTYELFTRPFIREDGMSAAVVLMGGGMAGAASWLFTYPIDVIKSRIQSDGIGSEGKYRGILHCLKSSIANDGAGVLFRGLNSSLIRAFPTNAATFAVVTWTMQMLAEQENNDDLLHTWKEVLARGEALVDAAGVPSTLQLAVTKQNQWQSSVAFLPQVMASSEVSPEEAEDGPSYFQRNCSCMREKLTSFSVIDRIPILLGSSYARPVGLEGQTPYSKLWMRCGDVLACTRPCQWALTKHQHNLSIVL